jgi:hypothetical protein
MDVDAVLVKQAGQARWQWIAVFLCLWLDSYSADDLSTIFQWSDDNA